MRRIIALFVLTTFCLSSVKSERILDPVYRPGSAYFYSAVLAGKILIVQDTTSHLLSYNDETFTRIPFPIVDGVRMRYSRFYKNKMRNFESSVFFGLGPYLDADEVHYLFRYSDGDFTRISTANLISNCIVYGSYLYFLCEVSGVAKLFRYSRGVVTEVLGSDIPRANRYELSVPGAYMYITGTSSDAAIIRRFDGTNFLTIRAPESFVFVNEIFEVTGTNNAYFTGAGRICFYDGRNLRLIFYDPRPFTHANFKIWDNELYFTFNLFASTFEYETHLYRLSGSVSTEIPAPPGYQIGPGQYTNLEIYEGLLHVSARFRDNSTHLLRYTGSSFEDIYTIPTPFVSFSSGTWLQLREGKLIIQPSYTEGYHAFEYNGVDLTEIRIRPGHKLGQYIGATDCNHLWSTYFMERPFPVPVYVRESKNCPPPPPPPGLVAVIPDDFMIHERFEGVAIGRDRGWCWNEIIFGWDTIPICPEPPCPPEPNYQLSMFDVNNKIAWSESFKKPSKFEVPLKDDQPYSTILSSIDSKTDLLIFDPDLVPKGIEEIKLLMVPKKGFFAISVSTRKKESVPFRVALLNEDGKEIWMQTFTAPFSMQITATVQKAGKTLVFSIPDDGSKFITQAKDP